MTAWFMWVQLAVALVAGLICLGVGARGRAPGDVSLGSLVLVEVLLVVQTVWAIVAPLAGNHPAGSLLEFWVYLVAALLISPAAGFWALVERSRWAGFILGIGGLSIAVMVYRMWQIWTWHQ